MILAFQILLFIFILLFGLAIVGSDDKEVRLQSTSIVIAGIVAMVITFYI